MASQPMVLGEFELRREIGRGGMGTVYEAWQASLDRTVAVKVLSSNVSSSPTAVLRFQREAQAAAKLHHSHIVPIFAMGEADGVYYYAMELIEGLGLNSIIAVTRDSQAADTATSDLAETVPLSRAEGSGGRGVVSAATRGCEIGISHQPAGPPKAGPPPATGARPESRTSMLPGSSGICSSEEFFATAARHVASIADALEYAHQQGVIHRDVKPHNLIMGNDGKMRISDFGLARLMEQPGVTITGELIGSPLYMSPEQISGGPARVDHRTDIYSLGATMYEWFTLNPPYPGETREQVIGKVLSSDPPALRAHNPAIPVDLETICLKAIERDRKRRYQRAGELRDDLQRFLASQPIKAKRAGLPSRVRRFIGRHQLASLATAAAVIALILGWALVASQREVTTQMAVAQQAKEREEKLLDLLNLLPVEIGAPLRAAGAALPMLEGVVRTGQRGSAMPGVERSGGADTAAARTAAEMTRRGTRDSYEAASARSEFRTSIPPLDPGQADEFTASLALARSLLKTDPAAALQILDACLAARPDHFEARQLRMTAYGRLGQYDKMLEDVAELVRLRR